MLSNDRESRADGILIGSYVPSGIDEDNMALAVEYANRLVKSMNYVGVSDRVFH